MRLSNYKIRINPRGLGERAAFNYESKVREHLLWIERTTTGKILLNSIKYHNLPVVIRPYTGGNCNARGGADWETDSLRGVVEYSPNTFSIHGACSATKTTPNRGLFWDEVLFHELIHVFRSVSKKWNNSGLSFGLHRYTDNEEFIAVMVTNIYISDTTNKIKTGLRADHKSLNPLSEDFDESFEFFSTSKMTFSLIEKFCKENTGFTRKVANEVADAAFNPLAAYYSDPKRAKEISDKSLSRDLFGLVEQVRGFFTRKKKP